MLGRAGQADGWPHTKTAGLRGRWSPVAAVTMQAATLLRASLATLCEERRVAKLRPGRGQQERLVSRSAARASIMRELPLLREHRPSGICN